MIKIQRYVIYFLVIFKQFILNLLIQIIYNAIIIMGQHNAANNNVFGQWSQNPHKNDILYNIVTHQQIHRHHIIIHDPQQLRSYSKRMHEPNPNICRVIYYHPLPQYEIPPKSFYIYTQCMFPITELRDDTFLVILKAFRDLLINYNPFRVQRNMIGQNQRGQIKVWLNSNPALNFIQNSTHSQSQMLGDIITILMGYNKQSASNLIYCKTLSEAIKKINKKIQNDSFNLSYNSFFQHQTTIPKYKINSLPFAQLNTQSWTVRNSNEERNFISQQKYRKDVIDCQFPPRNSNSTTKQNQIIKKSNFHQTNFIPTFSHNKVRSPKANLQKDDDQKTNKIFTSNQSINTSVIDPISTNNYKHFLRIQDKHGRINTINNKEHNKLTNYKLKQEIPVSVDSNQHIHHRKKYTSTYLKKDDQTDKIMQDNEINYHQQIPTSQFQEEDLNNQQKERQVQKKNKNSYIYKKNNQINSRNHENSTQNIEISKGQRQKNSIPSFISGKIKNQNSSKNSVFEDTLVFKDKDLTSAAKLETKKSGSNLGFKKLTKSEKEEQDQLNVEKQKNFIMISTDLNPQNHIRYGSNQQSSKRKEDLPLPLTQSGGDQNVKSPIKIPIKAQSENNNSSYDDSSQKDKSDLIKKKNKQQMTKQLKKQFGQILLWSNEQNSHNQKQKEQDYKSKLGHQLTKNTQKYLQAKFEGLNKGKNDKFEFLNVSESHGNQKEKEKMQNLVTKYTEKAHDQLIRQKVQKKKAIFADLKTQAMKILSDDFF